MIHGVTLRPYQQEAVDLMTGRGRALLSLTMGAGKTLTSIASIEELIDNGLLRTGLVILPSSLRYQWQDEIKRFTGQSALVIDGSPAQRKALYKLVGKFRYTIIGYPSVVNDWKIVRDLPYDFLICDEVSYCKSMTAKRAIRTKFLAKRAKVVFGLTGQPVENKAEELFSIMQVVDPDVLGDFRLFDPTFIVRDPWNKPIRYRNLKKLHAIMSEVMYRKTREDIADQFPRVQTTSIPFDLSPVERRVYNAAAHFTIEKLEEAKAKHGPSASLEHIYGVLNDAASMKMRGDIMSGLLIMRLAVDDPLLILDSAKNYADDDVKAGSKLAHSFMESGLLEGLPDISTKRVLFRERLEQILEEDEKNKVVVFSTFKGMIRRIQEDTAHLSKSVQFTGDMNGIEKRTAQRQFKQDPETRLFLSSDAGGYGVDLPEANYLDSIDLPWSTGAFEQREARVIRISSEWDHVNLATYIGRGTIEERMFQIIQNKRGVSEAFVDGKFDSEGAYTPTLGTLLQFLSDHVG